MAGAYGANAGTTEKNERAPAKEPPLILSNFSTSQCFPKSNELTNLPRLAGGNPIS
jgi:hypothetical protein